MTIRLLEGAGIKDLANPVSDLINSYIWITKYFNILKQIIARLTPLWYVIIGYQILVLIEVGCFDAPHLYQLNFLTPRALILVYLMFRLFTNQRFFARFGSMTDALVAYMLLGVFYSETAYLNTLVFPKIDSLLVNWDEDFFGFQPSVMFPLIFPNRLFSEMMYLGYFSYYLMPLVAMVVLWMKKPSQFNRFVFLIITSYFIYYLLFILLPAEGPQYYFISSIPFESNQGIMSYLVRLIQELGEAPTGAFPSSHVGITGILLVLIYPLDRSLFWAYLPFAILLLFSTVYIKAHYVVDVVAGLGSVPFVLLLSTLLYNKLNSASKPMVYEHTY